MNQDDTPTPRQSGSFGIMSGICEESKKSLKAWLATTRATASPDSVNMSCAIEQFIARFDALRTEIESWPRLPPKPERKAEVIGLVLTVRSEASDYAAKHGRRI
jgi:hypothetical protein